MEAEVGMLIVETIAKIRRAFFGQGKSIKAICRELRVSRKVVRKVIRSETTEFRCEREAQPLPKIGPWRDQLDQLLLTNEGKASRERLTLIRLFEELHGQGYDGGYDAVRRYARQWSKERGASTAAAYVPLIFAPGEAYQFDWSHEVVLLNGVTVIVKAAHVRLCHSRMMFVRAYPPETQEMVFDAHDRAFALFKGACRRGIYDNMKTARLRQLQSSAAGPKSSWRPPMAAAPPRSCGDPAKPRGGVALAGAVHGGWRGQPYSRQDPQTRQAAPACGHRAASGRFGARSAARRSNPLDRPDAGEGGRRELAVGAAHPGRSSTRSPSHSHVQAVE